MAINERKCSVPTCDATLSGEMNGTKYLIHFSLVNYSTCVMCGRLLTSSVESLECIASHHHFHSFCGEFINSIFMAVSFVIRPTEVDGAIFFYLAPLWNDLQSTHRRTPQLRACVRSLKILNSRAMNLMSTYVRKWAQNLDAHQAAGSRHQRLMCTAHAIVIVEITQEWVKKYLFLLRLIILMTNLRHVFMRNANENTNDGADNFSDQ